MCRVRLPLVVNAARHTLQLNAFTPRRQGGGKRARYRAVFRGRTAGDWLPAGTPARGGTPGARAASLHGHSRNRGSEHLSLDRRQPLAPPLATWARPRTERPCVHIPAARAGGAAGRRHRAPRLHFPGQSEPGGPAGVPPRRPLPLLPRPPGRPPQQLSTAPPCEVGHDLCPLSAVTLPWEGPAGPRPLATAATATTLPTRPRTHPQSPSCFVLCCLAAHLRSQVSLTQNTRQY